MKYLCSPLPVRAVSLSLSLVLLSPYVTVAAAAAPMATPATPPPSPAVPKSAGQTLCVLDFNDLSRAGGEGLGKVAASQFSSELAGRKHWEVVPDAQLRERAAKLELAMPLDRTARVRLAADAGSQQVVYGTITAARIQEKPARQAYVRMMVLVEDAKSGELLQGAISEGTSGTSPSATASRDQLFSEAMSNAAASFARYLEEPKTPATPNAVPGAAPTDRSIQEDAPAPQQEPTATATRIVTDKEAHQLFANVSAPDPVVIEIPNTGLESNGAARRSLFTTRALRLLVGGILFAGLLYLGGAGGFGSTRPF